MSTRLYGYYVTKHRTNHINCTGTRYDQIKYKRLRIKVRSDQIIYLVPVRLVQQVRCFTSPFTSPQMTLKLFICKELMMQIEPNPTITFKKITVHEVSICYVLRHRRF